MTQHTLRPTEFWAVKDVSFDIKRGECLGIIGHNGAGKSTIFKLLSGIYGPTEGRIELQGNLSALLEVGAGFHPMLTGRENIYISGSIRGMTNDEIRRKYDRIVVFSGVGDFIDMPIKFYSSGMLVRLGFAVLAHLEPDILLIDEILAVGDMAFQKQCIDHINKLRESNMAIALVSHSLYRIESLCHRTIWMDQGMVKMEGDTRDVIKAYRENENQKIANLSSGIAGGENEFFIAKSDFLIVHKVESFDAQGNKNDSFPYGDDIFLRLSYTALEKITKPRFNFRFSNEGKSVFEAGMLIDGKSPDFIDGYGEIVCRVRKPCLLPKVYAVQLFVNTEEGAVYLMEPMLVHNVTIRAEGLDKLPSVGPYAIGHLMSSGVVYLDYEWDLARAVIRPGREG